MLLPSGRNLSEVTQHEVTNSWNLAFTTLILQVEGSLAPSLREILVKIRMFIHMTRILSRETEVKERQCIH